MKNIPLLALFIIAAHPRISAGDEDFTMRIMDVFSITGRGTVMTGQIATGAIGSDDTVCVPLVSGETVARPVKGIEMFRKVLDHAEAGQRVGILVEGLNEDIAKGSVLHGRCRSAPEPED